MRSVLVQTLLVLASLIAEEIHVNSANVVESYLWPMSVEGKWGYINKDGEAVVEPKYVRAHEFSDGLAEVEFFRTRQEYNRAGKTYSGYIDVSGRLVFPAESQAVIIAKQETEKYVYYGEFSEGLVKVYHTEKDGVGYADRNGKIVIQPQFSSCSPFGEGLAHATTLMPSDGRALRQGFINQQGVFVIDINARDSVSVKPFRFGRVVVSIRERAVLLDSTGNQILGPFDEMTTIDGGTCVVRDEREYGLFDRNGQVVVPFGTYDEILPSESGLVLTASRNGIWYILSSRGELLAEAQPGQVLSFAREGLVPFRQNGKEGFLDDRGRVVIDPVYDRVEGFRHGLARVFMGSSRALLPQSHAGYIDQTGKMVWRTDRWDEPLRNSLREPLASLLPKSTIEALPFSRNRGGVKNAVVFVASESVESLRQWFLAMRAKDLEVHDRTTYEYNPGQIGLSIWGESQFDVSAIEGGDEEADADGFVESFACENMESLRTKYPKNTIGIIIEDP